MKIPDTRVIVFNVAGALVTFAALAAVVRSLVFSPTVAAPCTGRYASGTLFSLERNGVLLASADLQARLAGTDVGLVENVEIARVKGGPSPVAMGVTLAKGSASPHGSGSTKGGVSFHWEPRAMKDKTAGCLTYSVLLPANFDFHNGGTLPGIRGALASGQSGDGFVAPLAWRRNGRGAVNDREIIGGEQKSGASDMESFSLPAGRWVKVEQEVVLNAPDQADGILRVWVDGQFVIERTDMIYRNKPEVLVAGVAAEVFYGNEDPASGAPADATVWLSPFEMRWQ